MNKKRFQFILLGAVFVSLMVALALPAGAGDLDKKLNGDYYGNGSFFCTYPDPATDILGIVHLPHTVGGSLEGVTSFDGKGGFTSSGEALVIDNGDFSALKLISACEGTYTVYGDLRYTTTAVCKYSVPSVPGFEITVSNMQSTGQLAGTLGDILLFRSSTERNLEPVKMTIDHGTGIVYTYLETARFCSSAGTSMKPARPTGGYELRKKAND